MSDYDGLYAKLNDEQRLAVDHLDGPMMVIAGAGTGKTQVIAMRIANILRTGGVEPFNILCLTFTESGVLAMRERLIRILGTAGYYVRVHTFHSFCQEVISEHPQLFVFAKELELMQDLEKIRYVNSVLDERPIHDALKTFGDPYFYRTSILQQISNLKREGVSAASLREMAQSSRAFLERHRSEIDGFISLHATKITEQDVSALLTISQTAAMDERMEYLYRAFATVLQQGLAEMNVGIKGKTSYRRVKELVKNFVENLEKHVPKQISLADVYERYQELLGQNGRYDFDDMVLFVLKELSNNRMLLAEYQERYPYILVDEYQDTNAAQNSLARLFGEGVEMPNIFVVGDDDQAIYRFQGANLDNIIAFYRHYDAGVKIVTLKNNYRSHQEILEIADNVIENNLHRVNIYLPQVSKKLGAIDSAPKEQSKLFVFERVEDELGWLTSEVRTLLDSGVPDSEIAVLCRTNRQVGEIAEYFDNVGMRYRLEAGESIFDVVQIQQLILLLEVCENPYEDAKFFSLMHAKFLGLAVLDVMKIHNYVLTHVNENKKRAHYFEIISDNSILEELGVGVEAFSKLQNNLVRWMQESGNVSLPVLIELIINESGLLQFADEHQNKLVLLSALKVFIEQVHEFFRQRNTVTLGDFLEYLAEHREHGIAISYFVSRIDGAGVRILTAHKSKGLEYEYVFLPQCTDANWGAGRSRELIKLPPHMVANDTAILSKQDVEDERRLFYVALTRTKKGLKISFAKLNAEGKAVSPSRFLQEIQEQNIARVEMGDYRGERSVIVRRAWSHEERLNKELIEARLRDLRLTATNVNDYLHCPRLFYYRHFLRAPMMKNKYMALGTATHEAVEALYRSVMPDASSKEIVVLGKEEMLAVFEKKLWKEMAYQKEYEMTLEKGKSILSSYYDFYCERLVKPLFIEYDFFADHVFLDEIPLSGKVDMIELVDGVSRQVIFYDFKTGNPEKKQREMQSGEAIWRQMVFYELLASISGRFSGKYKLQKSIVDFVEPMEDGGFLRREMVIAEEECEAVRQEIRTVWDGVRELRFDCSSGESKCDFCKDVLIFAEEE